MRFLTEGISLGTRRFCLHFAQRLGWRQKVAFGCVQPPQNCAKRTPSFVDLCSKLKRHFLTVGLTYVGLSCLRK